LARETLLVCKEMGWEIEYVMNLSIFQYNAVVDMLKWYYEKVKVEL